jgi:hypothetical protein
MDERSVLTSVWSCFGNGQEHGICPEHVFLVTNIEKCAHICVELFWQWSGTRHLPRTRIPPHQYYKHRAVAETLIGDYELIYTFMLVSIATGYWLQDPVCVPGRIICISSPQ